MNESKFYLGVCYLLTGWANRACLRWRFILEGNKIIKFLINWGYILILIDAKSEVFYSKDLRSLTLRLHLCLNNLD